MNDDELETTCIANVLTSIFHNKQDWPLWTGERPLPKSSERLEVSAQTWTKENHPPITHILIPGTAAALRQDTSLNWHSKAAIRSGSIIHLCLFPKMVMPSCFFYSANTRYIVVGLQHSQNCIWISAPTQCILTKAHLGHYPYHPYMSQDPVLCSITHSVALRAYTLRCSQRYVFSTFS